MPASNGLRTCRSIEVKARGNQDARNEVEQIADTSVRYPPAMNLARRVTDHKPSATVAVTNRAKDLKRQGVDVLSFAAGEPDFDTPRAIKDAAIAAMNAGQTKYMPTMGDPETRSAIAEKVTRENRIPGVTAEHVGISSGGKH